MRHLNNFTKCSPIALGFAQTMLEKAGDFYLFGATLAPDGVVAAGGERAAAIYSLIETASLMGLIPKLCCTMCWPVLLIILSTASTSSFLGTSPHSWHLPNDKQLPKGVPGTTSSIS